MTSSLFRYRRIAVPLRWKLLTASQYTRDVALLTVVTLLIAVTEFIFAYQNVAYGIIVALFLALGLAALSALAPVSPAMSRALDSLNLLPLYILLTSSLPWFLLDQQLLLPAVYYCIIVLCLRHLHSQGRNITSPEALGLRRRHALRFLLLGAVIGVPTGTMEYAILLPAPELPFLDLKQVARDILYMVVFVGFTEELLFRGVLQNDIAEVLGWKGGLFFSSLLFGIMHMTWRSVPELGFTFGAGLLLGYFYWRSRSLVGPIALHAVNNVVLVSIMPYVIRAGA
ncbi:MAG: CPBP family intramembrane metalloprotease [Chloroflexi bacterium]|nr:CPBP family intramembrane metalloprotease [Chloroflexota bacterium]